MNKLLGTIEVAQKLFRSRLEGLLKTSQGLSEEQYVRYLSMQYHLTNGVQRHFLQIAGNFEMARRRTFRKFLVGFANEEELHFEIAGADLKAMNRTPLPCPLDVTLWWAYFDSIVASRPFIRLGATTILENIAAPSRDVIQQLFANARYLTPKNTRFFTIHQHDETLPHGDQILDALKSANLEPQHIADLELGAQIGAVMYLRMVDWALSSGEQQKPDAFFQGLVAA